MCLEAVFEGLPWAARELATGPMGWCGVGGQVEGAALLNLVGLLIARHPASSGGLLGLETGSGRWDWVIALVWVRGEMGQHWGKDASQGNTMEQYTTPVPLPQRPARSEGSGDDMRVPANPEEPSRVELLGAIQGSRVALEGKIETAAVEVNLLRADLRKVSDKVKVMEGSIVELQMEVGVLRKQMA
ncbi:hypothetical protein NDU88_004653 [Pleurodeles waltl]|uniref:Uncharacterized protein n=1 Tax=Pleurodeles waltl TaxID=8319 RepID=A0AAV7PLK7_PLEWA|nr:hypothetical protein NDU88_004653 [Pleurodeles waltl]